MPEWKVLLGNNKETIKKIDDDSIQTVVTSPPYYALRAYGGAECNEGEIGLEESPEEFIASLCDVFDEIKPKLKNTGTLWVNLGDTYASNTSAGVKKFGSKNFQETRPGRQEVYQPKKKITGDLKNKDLIGIPWMFAFEMRKRGWYLRQDIIWCLSGGAKVYVKTPTSTGPMMIKDVYRLDPKNVKLWNGEKWTQLLGMNISTESNRDNMIEIHLRNGEKVGCTKNHKWPLNNGDLVLAGDLKVGDVLKRCILPDEEDEAEFLNEDVGWLIGIYLAEGSKGKNGKCLQIARHTNEYKRYERIKEICKKFDSTCCDHSYENRTTDNIYGEVVIGIINQYINGRDAYSKKLDKKVWSRSNSFLKAILEGYLEGDGHWDEDNQRWRLGFCRNEDLADDLRSICARLGWKIKLQRSYSTYEYKGEKKPIFKGEIRITSSGQWGCKEDMEIVKIEKSRARKFYDLGVEDEPHLFALASGVLTHNSKDNPMPESVTDRCTKSHEYIFLFSKEPDYYFDYEILKEQTGKAAKKARRFSRVDQPEGMGRNDQDRMWVDDGTRRKRSVWQIPVAASQAIGTEHFATYPEKLILPCILSGSAEGDLVMDPFNGSGTTGVVALKNGRNYIGCELYEKFKSIYETKLNDAMNKRENSVDANKDLFEW